MDAPDDLLPCPWCGGKAAVETFHFEPPYQHVPTEYFINCSHESTSCPVNLVFVGPCATIQEAARRWNTRFHS